VSGGVEGNTVLVIGGGPIGLGVVLMAIEAGASKVIVSEPDPVRRACALELGADAAFDPLSEKPAKAISAAGFRAPDVVFECVGAPSLLQQTVDVMARHGRGVIVGVCRTEDRFYPARAVGKQVALFFALGYTDADFDFVVRYLANNAERAGKMISQVVSMADLPDTFDRLQKQKSLVKVMMKP
ncbi:MAG: zinc-binding dehydrogenase, partial [Nitratireductor sp.]|nr:zinc-binding dehydrogenase [Nitratireductor sp.]